MHTPLHRTAAALVAVLLAAACATPSKDPSVVDAKAAYITPPHYADVPCDRLALDLARAQDDAARLTEQADSALQKNVMIGVLWAMVGAAAGAAASAHTGEVPLPSYMGDDLSDSKLKDNPAERDLTRAKAESTAMVMEYNRRCVQPNTPPKSEVYYPPRWTPTFRGPGEPPIN